MRGVDQQNVNACRYQRVYALFVAGTGADRRAYAQTALLIFTGVRFTFCFLEVFDGDHAAQVEALIHDQRFLNAFFVHLSEDHFTAFAFTNGDQTLFRRHVDADRLVQIGDETHVAAGDDANQLVFFGNHRVAGETVALGQLFHFTQSGRRQNSLRVGDHAGLMFLHATNFFRLALDGHVFVNKANAAFLGQGNSQTRFRYGIHGCGEHRNIQTNGFRQLSAEIGSIRQNGRMSGNEEDVVKRQGFFSDT